MSANLKKKSLALGTWGGQHISFEVTGKGVKVEYDCAYATIDRTIVVDANGRFKVPGTQFHQHGGPVREDEPKGVPVIFSGDVEGRTMTLKVQNSSTREDLGTFTLVHGASPKLFKCL